VATGSRAFLRQPKGLVPRRNDRSNRRNQILCLLAQLGAQNRHPTLRCHSPQEICNDGRGHVAEYSLHPHPTDRVTLDGNSDCLDHPGSMRCTRHWMNRRDPFSGGRHGYQHALTPRNERKVTTERYATLLDWLPHDHLTRPEANARCQSVAEPSRCRSEWKPSQDDETSVRGDRHDLNGPCQRCLRAGHCLSTRGVKQFQATGRRVADPQQLPVPAVTDLAWLTSGHYRKTTRQVSIAFEQHYGVPCSIKH